LNNNDIYIISTDRCVVEILLVVVILGLPPYAQTLPRCVLLSHFYVIVTDLLHAEEDNMWKRNVYFFSLLIGVENSWHLLLLLPTRLTPKHSVAQYLPRRTVLAAWRSCDLMPTSVTLKIATSKGSFGGYCRVALVSRIVRLPLPHRDNFKLRLVCVRGCLRAWVVMLPVRDTACVHRVCLSLAHRTISFLMLTRLWR
jgi:hypothetical protein